MDLKDAFEFASYVVTVVALPFAVWVFFVEQRKERENEEEEAYQHLSDAYNDFLKIVLDNADLQLRTNAALPNPTPEQNERMLVIFDMLMSLFERAYLTAWGENMNPAQQRRWNVWEDFMREWIRRDDFHLRIEALLVGEDPDFQAYFRELVRQERGSVIVGA